MISKQLICITLVTAFILLSGICTGQIERAGVPPGFSLQGSLYGISRISISPPDKLKLADEDNRDALLEKPYRVGVVLPADIDLLQSGTWVEVEGKGRICQLQISIPGANAIGLDYTSLYLPPLAELYVYSANRSSVIGAFTSEFCNGRNSFYSRPVRGDDIILEYYQPDACVIEANIRISGFNYIYRGLDIHPESSLKNFGGSGSCEVNINCSEGSVWKSQADGVVRILARVGNQSFWCTGVVVNNTNVDYLPYVLTANHCSEAGVLVSKPVDLEKWTFYFNYESGTCEDPVYEPVEHSMVGALKLASSQPATEIGSDFFLMRLLQNIPSSYHPYYNGWSHENTISENGAGIHHPQGDIKKISTYVHPLESGNWQSIPNTHWTVHWASSPNGHGVTEPGSSGSPIFDQNGLVIGTLTGGESGCSNLNGKDFYGKFAYSWQSNGTVDSMQLKPWLDPNNHGVTALQGTYTTKLPIADFKADTTVVVVGGTLGFSDLSSHEPDAWEWYFEGGIPAFSNERNPSGIRYDTCGEYLVRLTATNSFGSDSLVRMKYIKVKARIFPNPTHGHVTIFTNSTNVKHTLIQLYSVSGMLVKEWEWNGTAGKAIELDLPKSGKLFYLKMAQDDEIQVFPVIVFSPFAD